MAVAGDIASATSACPHGTRRVAHRVNHPPVLPHAKVVVGAPDHDLPLAERAVPERKRKMACLPLKVCKDPVAVLIPQRGECRFEVGEIVDHDNYLLSALVTRANYGHPVLWARLTDRPVQT